MPDESLWGTRLTGLKGGHLSMGALGNSKFNGGESSLLGPCS